MTLDLIKQYKIKAKKSLWQNFLVNEEILEGISSSVDIEWKNIVEVWPWYGALTEKILGRKPSSLTLVELDNDMIRILESRVWKWELKVDDVDFEIENIDVLKYSPGFRSYEVIANIPYYITSPILRYFLYDVENVPENMLILMQKDVGDKILLWQDDSSKIRSSVISLFVAKKCKVKEVLFVWKENFVPAPKVESSVLLFETHDLYRDIDDELFLDTIKKWFSSPRKKLLKNLISGGFEKQRVLDVFEKLWLWDNVRAEDLWVGEWCELVNNLF